ncbi:hypothetical protein [Falsiroseomonas sp. HW251]|uniref:hypothetical protein n=1 Tax=Falsiroseomonas sp. HW251 TaxID=3390998 RepID=UPI003D312F41
MRLSLLLAAALLGACAEMRTPPAASRVPAGLGVMAADPVPAMAADAARVIGTGRGLQGRTGEVARAIGQMELVTQALTGDARWGALPVAVNAEITPARLEWRSVLGIRAGATPDAAAAALGQVAIATGRGDTRAAAAALDPAVFDPGGAPTLARLASPEPLPQTASGARVAAEATQALAARGLVGVAVALDPDAGRTNMPGGPGSEGLPPLR